jgi:hypothetical protein
LIVARLIADDSLFAVQCMIRKLLKQEIGDERLSLDVDLKLDVVRFGRVDASRQVKVTPQQLAGGVGGFGSRIEVVRHAKK